ncbi:hypothetical protein ON010_g6100 [Phytophthora cinnamomi]|nr:hypothetical protein ON010_g6100 [Phytophthora cinnamomi]
MQLLGTPRNTFLDPSSLGLCRRTNAAAGGGRSQRNSPPTRQTSPIDPRVRTMNGKADIAFLLNPKSPASSAEALPGACRGRRRDATRDAASDVALPQPLAGGPLPGAAGALVLTHSEDAGLVRTRVRKALQQRALLRRRQYPPANAVASCDSRGARTSPSPAAAASVTAVAHAARWLAAASVLSCTSAASSTAATRRAPSLAATRRPSATATAGRTAVVASVRFRTVTRCRLRVDYAGHTEAATAASWRAAAAARTRSTVTTASTTQD